LRTTIRFDEQLLKRAKKVAAERGTTLNALLEDALKVIVHRREPEARSRKVRLTITGRGGVRPNVNLDGRASLLGIMEARDGRD
jgi:hypothetical protein